MYIRIYIKNFMRNFFGTCKTASDKVVIIIIKFTRKSFADKRRKFSSALPGDRVDVCHYSEGT